MFGEGTNTTRFFSL